MRIITATLAALLCCAAPAAADTAYDQLKKGASGADIFDGGARAGAPAASLKGGTTVQAAVPAAEVKDKAEKKATAGKVKKAAPYVYITVVSLLIGLAIFGFSAPALAFAAAASLAGIFIFQLFR